MSTDENNVLQFQFLKIEKGRSKLCKCNPPHYEIDVVNRIVVCTDCGAVIDPFEALVTLCSYEDKLTEYQEKALEKAKVYSEMADKEFRRRIKNAVFKNMDSNYRKDLYPICPECKKIINPVKITNYANKRIYDEFKGGETNADKIRNMSDEELADWLSNMCNFEKDGELYKSFYNLDTEKEEEIRDSYGDLLEWLQSEAR